MSDPTAFLASYNFSGFQSVSPNTPLPGTQVDIQFAALEETTAELVAAIKDVRRSDGALKNQSVGPDQLSPALSLGFTNRGTWADATAYSTGDGVVYGTTFYSALSTHTSSVSTRPDTDATTWQLLFTFESIIVADGAITPAKLSADEAGFQAKIGLGTLAVEDVEYLDTRIEDATEHTVLVDDDLFPVLDSTALFVGKNVKWATLLAKVQAATISPTPIGVILEYAGTTAPTGWLLCYGQAIDRTTYSDLFAVIGTTHGAGNGTTTFNVPDHRGRVVAGKDDMGGSSANRLTNQSGGLNGDTLAATGGAETHTLTTAQLAVHGHGAGDYEAEDHGHPVRYNSLDNASVDPSGSILIGVGGADDTSAWTGSPSSTRGRQIGGAGELDISGTSSSAGSGSAHNNVQPTIIENKIIYAGI